MLFTVAAVSALAIGVSAGHAAHPLHKRQDATPTCMSDSEASTVADNFARMIENNPFPTALAQAALTADYTDYTDSVITLINQGCTSPVPFGLPTFSNRDDFIAAQGTQPTIPFEKLNVWNNCDTVFLRWRTTEPKPAILAPPDNQLVTGTIVLEAIQNNDTSSDQPWLIDTVYSEFNSGAWVVDNGNFTPSCDANGNATPASKLKRMAKLF